MLWSVNLFLKRQQWGLVSCPNGKNTTSVGVFKTDFFFRGTGSLPLALREKLFLYLLSILGWSTYFIFSPSLSESAVRQYFKSLICFWSHYVQYKMVHYKMVRHYKNNLFTKLYIVRKQYMLKNGTLHNGTVTKRYIAKRYTDIMICYIIVH